MTYQSANPIIIADILSVVGPEIRNAASDSDLEKRLEGLGYGYRDTARGRMLTTLPHGIEIAPISAV